MCSNATVQQLVLDRFRASGLEPVTVEVKNFPGETIVVVEVDREHDLAVDIARELDAEIPSGFVTVRQAHSRKKSQQRELVSSVHDERIPRLIELMNARARTSEAQPSLRYVADVAESANCCIVRSWLTTRCTKIIVLLRFFTSAMGHEKHRNPNSVSRRDAS